MGTGSRRVGEGEQGAKVIEGMESRGVGTGSKNNRGNGRSGSGEREQK